MTDKLSRMKDVARDHANVVDVLFSCGEFTAAEIIEHAPDVEQALAAQRRRATS